MWSSIWVLLLHHLVILFLISCTVLSCNTLWLPQNFPIFPPHSYSVSIFISFHFYFFYDLEIDHVFLGKCTLVLCFLVDKFQHIIKSHVFLSLSSIVIFMLPLSRTTYSLIPDLAMNFRPHMPFLFFTCKGDKYDAIFVHLVVSCYIVSQRTGSHVVIRICWKAMITLVVLLVFKCLRILGLFSRLWLGLIFIPKHNSFKSF